MAARNGPSYQMSHTHRDKIKNSNILNALIEHVEGKRDMSGSQVQAGLGLLKKIMPDLANMQIEGVGEDGKIVLEISTGVPRAED